MVYKKLFQILEIYETMQCRYYFLSVFFVDFWKKVFTRSIRK